MKINPELEAAAAARPYAFAPVDYPASEPRRPTRPSTLRLLDVDGVVSLESVLAASTTRDQDPERVLGVMTEPLN